RRDLLRPHAGPGFGAERSLSRSLARYPPRRRHPPQVGGPPVAPSATGSAAPSARTSAAPSITTSGATSAATSDGGPPAGRKTGLVTLRGGHRGEKLPSGGSPRR